MARPVRAWIPWTPGPTSAFFVSSSASTWEMKRSTRLTGYGKKGSGRRRAVNQSGNGSVTDAAGRSISFPARELHSGGAVRPHWGLKYWVGDPALLDTLPE